MERLKEMDVEELITSSPGLVLQEVAAGGHSR
jgi:hypothetical protein